MSTPTRSRGPYAKSALVRSSIVEAALDLFGTSGYRGTTMKDVADRVGMTPTGMSYYFTSKDDLLAAVLAERDDRTARVAAKSITDIESLITSMLRHNIEDRGLAELHCVLSAEATAAEHPAHEYFSNRYRTLRRDLATAIHRWKADGSDLESAQADATAVLALLDGVQLQWLLAPDEVDMPAVVRRALGHVLGVRA